MIIGIIPARYRSTRLPGKPLIDLAGKTMIQRVYEGASKARLLNRVIVATDDERILETVQSFGGEAVMTSPHHPTGTDRLAEVAQGVACDLVVNIQGDEPLIDGATIDAVIEPLLIDASIPMGTAMMREDDPKILAESSVVKVVTDSDGFAMYFSRSLIPYPRQGGEFFKHIGMYVYRREFLLQLNQLPQAPPEVMESLEQLRVLYHGYRIKVTEVQGRFIGVDTPEDAALVRTILEEKVRG